MHFHECFLSILETRLDFLSELDHEGNLCHCWTLPSRFRVTQPGHRCCAPRLIHVDFWVLPKTSLPGQLCAGTQSPLCKEVTEVSG